MFPISKTELLQLAVYARTAAKLDVLFNEGRLGDKGIERLNFLKSKLVEVLGPDWKKETDSFGKTLAV